MEQKHIAEFDYNTHEIERALFFLSNALQNSGHNSKPVLLHTIGVAEMLWERGLPQDAVIAGILHDVVEDTDVTLDEIEENFGQVVKEYVDALTLSDVQDIYQSFAQCAELGEAALSIRAADLIQNSYYYHLAPIEMQKTLKAKFTRFLHDYKDKIDVSIQSELQRAYSKNVIILPD